MVDKSKLIKALKNKKDKDDDIFSSPKALSDHGVYFFNDSVYSGSVGEAIKFILEANLNPECVWDHITLIINSEGGNCNDGFALIDIMFGSRIPIHTVGIGILASMGLQIFLAGTKGYRVMTPNCMALSHQFTGMSWGKEHELVAAQVEHNMMAEIIFRHYKRTTGLSDEKIRENLLPAQDVWLTATKAKKLGICDIIKDLKPSHLNTSIKKKK